MIFLFHNSLKQLTEFRKNLLIEKYWYDSTIFNNYLIMKIFDFLLNIAIAFFIFTCASDTLFHSHKIPSSIA